MDYSLFGGHPLPKPVLTYCYSDTSEHILMKLCLKFIFIQLNAFEIVVLPFCLDFKVVMQVIHDLRDGI